MLVEEQKLRWWGMDMRPRRRRRIATVVCFIVLVVICGAASTHKEINAYWRGLWMACLCVLWLRLSVFRLENFEAEFRLDERERLERDNAERWSLKEIAKLLLIFATVTLGQAADHRHSDPMATPIELWFFFLLTYTLPIARVLWTEPDVLELSGEMKLAEHIGGEV